MRGAEQRDCTGSSVWAPGMKGLSTLCVPSSCQLTPQLMTSHRSDETWDFQMDHLLGTRGHHLLYSEVTRSRTSTEASQASMVPGVLVSGRVIGMIS